MSRTYNACLKPIGNRGAPPPAFLDVIIDTLAAQPASLFAKNAALRDIYAVMEPHLGPWEDDGDRRAAGCEFLRILAAEESGFDWYCGEDMSAPHGRPMSAWETGAFQVSPNSMDLDPTGNLRAMVRKTFGADDPATFLNGMKANHPFAVIYCMTLLRIRVDWDGPILSGAEEHAASRAAQAEFKKFLSAV